MLKDNDAWTGMTMNHESQKEGWTRP